MVGKQQHLRPRRGPRGGRDPRGNCPIRSSCTEALVREGGSPPHAFHRPLYPGDEIPRPGCCMSPPRLFTNELIDAIRNGNTAATARFRGTSTATSTYCSSTTSSSSIRKRSPPTGRVFPYVQPSCTALKKQIVAVFSDTPAQGNADAGRTV